MAEWRLDKATVKGQHSKRQGFGMWDTCCRFRFCISSRRAGVGDRLAIEVRAPQSGALSEHCAGVDELILPPAARWAASVSDWI